MIVAIRNLNQSEKLLIQDAPLLVGLLIAGSDGNIDNKEVSRLSKSIQSKSAKFGGDLEKLYQNLSYNLNAKIVEIIRLMPEDIDDRNRAIVRDLGRLNQVFQKIEKQFASEYYKSLRRVALDISRASGGIAGINSISSEERKFVRLSMILDPTEDHTVKRTIIINSDKDQESP